MILYKDASKFDILDLRDMEEPVSLMPDFESFRAMSDEAVGQLRNELNAQSSRQTYGSGLNYEVPHSWQELSDAITFNDFRKWRRYGRPDTEMSHQELRIRLQDTLANHLKRDPGYNKVPDDFTAFPPSAKAAASGVLRYLFDTDCEAPFVDTYSLYNTIGLSDGQVQELLEKDVLVPYGGYIGPDGNRYGTFVLSDRYITYWWTHGALLYNAEDE